MSHQAMIASMALNEKKERVIKIVFPFNYEMLEKVRTLPGRRYHKDLQVWSAPIYESTIRQLVTWGFTLDKRLSDFLERVSQRRGDMIAGNIPGFLGQLYPFQKQGVAFIENNNGRVLIADEMGLGKTIQALAWLQMHPELRPAIVVCPASLKLNWQQEAFMWMSNPNIEILNGATPKVPRGSIIIINYDILQYWIGQLKCINPQVLIVDECHYIKNRKAHRTKALRSLGKGIPKIIGLSGTPIVNRPIEGFNIFNMISPDLFENYWKFAQRYCAPIHTGFGWNFSGATNIKELHDKLVGSIMLRRLKKDVLTELPEKTFSFVPIELDNQDIYNVAENNFLSFIEAMYGAEAAERASLAEQFTQVETLRQVAVQGKLESAISWIRNFLEIEDKLVVFAWHTSITNALVEAFGASAVKYDGSMTAKQKDEVKNRFQTDPDVHLFVGNIKAAGVGITLTASSNVAFLELPWTPGDLDQAADRCHRIGQKDNVTVYYLLAKGTIEERMAKIIDHKRKVLTAVHDGIEVEDSSLLAELIKSYIKR